jgi:hypothetical protein
MLVRPSPIVTSLAVAALVAACSGSTGSTGSSPTDASTSDVVARGDGGSGSGGDGAASSDSGEVITDGGSNPVLDGSGDDGGGDNAPDGGACNTITDTATGIASTCASVEPTLGGGALVAGTYHLTAVTAYGSDKFCKSEFVPVGFKETVDLAVAAGVGTADAVLQLEMTKERRTSSTLTPGANGASPLTAQDTCPASTTTEQVKYESTTTGGKTVLILRLAYGKDSEADYQLASQ